MIIDAQTVIEPLPTDDLFERKEKSWRVALPADFIAFYKENSGAKPTTRLFLCNEHEYVIDRFLCILNETRKHPLGVYDISVVLTHLDARLWTDKDMIGEDLIPFAALFAGDFLCLDYRESDNEPSVCVWLHEKSEDWHPYTIEAFTDFGAFLDGVYGR